jgi:hypothetical protein
MGDKKEEKSNDMAWVLLARSIECGEETAFIEREKIKNLLPISY